MLTNYAKKKLKEEQEKKEKERREVVAGRVGEPKDISKLSDGNLILIFFGVLIFFLYYLNFSEQLKAVCKEYYQRIQKIESEKWDLEQSTAAKDMKVLLISDVVREQKSGSGWVQGLLFGFWSGSGINILGMSPSGFRGFLR